MVRGNRKVLALGVALLGLAAVRQLSFVPGPLRKAAPAAVSAASLMMAPAAFADEIRAAAKQLGDASCDVANEVDCNNGISLQALGKFQPLDALTAIDKMIVMGASVGGGRGASQGHRKHQKIQRCDLPG